MHWLWNNFAVFKFAMWLIFLFKLQKKMKSHNFFRYLTTKTYMIFLISWLFKNRFRVLSSLRNTNKELNSRPFNSKFKTNDIKFKRYFFYFFYRFITQDKKWRIRYFILKFLIFIFIKKPIETVFNQDNIDITFFRKVFWDDAP